MSLASRLSAFFLAALAAVLIGFSSALYVLASDHLHRQVDERLESALATLTAAVEIGPTGVEWEPDERELGLGRDPGADQVRWMVRDGQGQVVDRSANLVGRRVAPDLVGPGSSPSGRLRARDGGAWTVRARRVLPAGAPRATEGAPSGRKTAPEEFPMLELVAMAPLGPTEAMLHRLAATLLALSASVWVLAAAGGRWLSRRALAPLIRMAAAARDANAIEPDARLPVPATGDELADLGRALNGLLDRLHEALERQRRFTGDASHQLRTPLAALLSQVDVALRRERPPDEYRRVLGLVRSRAAHLRQIVESLLFLARAEAEAELPDTQVVDLAAWLPEHLESWAGHRRARDITVALEGSEALPARVHRPLLAQLVDNLLENAFKYSPPATPVRVRLGREPGTVVLAVADEGRGLSGEELAQIFEPFYRSPGARREGQAGVGLGLAVARRIASAFGGSIRVESQPGVGSRFEVRLPEAKAAVGSTGKPTDARRATGAGEPADRPPEQTALSGPAAPALWTEAED